MHKECNLLDATSELGPALPMFSLPLSRYLVFYVEEGESVVDYKS